MESFKTAMNSGNTVANKLRECRQIWRDVIAKANNLVAETGLQKPSAPPSGGREIDRGYARHHWQRRDRSFLLAGHLSGNERGRTSPGYRAPKEGSQEKTAGSFLFTGGEF